VLLSKPGSLIDRILGPFRRPQQSVPAVGYEKQERAIMRAIDLVSVSLVMMTLLVTDADAASNRWCASTPRRSENCGYATLDQCRAYVLGLGGWCRPNPFSGTAFDSGTWSSGPPRQYRGGY